MRENALRALRFGPRPERQQKREAIWQDPKGQIAGIGCTVVSDATTPRSLAAEGRRAAPH